MDQSLELFLVDDFGTADSFAVEEGAAAAPLSFFAASL
jgi:hypothetical protein